LDGTWAGIEEKLPDYVKTDAAGSRSVHGPCWAAGPVVAWGKSCDSFDSYKTSLTLAGAGGDIVAYEEGSTESTTEANIKCYESDNTSYPVFTGTANCSLMPMGNGLVQYRWKVTCADAASMGTVAGPENCKRNMVENADPVWVSFKDYVGYDDWSFRTLGNANFPTGGSRPKCRSADKKSVLTGTTNCFAHLISGKSMDNIDQYVWLPEAMAECVDTDSTALTGSDKCAPTVGQCTNSILGRLNLASQMECYEKITWAKK